MICRHKLYHFTVANTRFTAPLTRRGKTKFATVFKVIQFMPANHSITNVLSPKFHLSKGTDIKSLVRPSLEYACSVWDPYFAEDINKLESIQRRTAKYVTGRQHYTSSVSEAYQTEELMQG